LNRDEALDETARARRDGEDAVVGSGIRPPIENRLTYDRSPDKPEREFNGPIRDQRCRRESRETETVGVAKRIRGRAGAGESGPEKLHGEEAEVLESVRPERLALFVGPESILKSCPARKKDSVRSDAWRPARVDGENAIDGRDVRPIVQLPVTAEVVL